MVWALNQVDRTQRVKAAHAPTSSEFNTSRFLVANLFLMSSKTSSLSALFIRVNVCLVTCCYLQ